MTSVLRLVWGAGDLLVRASGEGRQKNRQCLARAKSRSLSLRRRQCVRVVQLYQDDFHCQVPRGSPTVWKAKQMTVVVAIRVRQLSVSHSKATSILPLTETLPQCSKWAHCDAGGVCAKKKKNNLVESSNSTRSPLPLLLAYLCFMKPDHFREWPLDPGDHLSHRAMYLPTGESSRTVNHLISFSSYTVYWFSLLVIARDYIVRVGVLQHLHPFLHVAFVLFSFIWFLSSFIAIDTCPVISTPQST